MGIFQQTLKPHVYMDNMEKYSLEEDEPFSDWRGSIGFVDYMGLDGTYSLGSLSNIAFTSAMRPFPSVPQASSPLSGSMI